MAQLPFYRDLTPKGIGKLATRVFILVDTNALDFMTNYNLVLAVDVHRELADGIKRTVMNGIATGKGVEDISRDLGRVVKDPKSFRHAGSKVFSKAQYRMEVIARTEVLRAHNQGRIKFHDQVEPGFDHSDLTGAALKAKLKEHKIDLLRTKDDLVKLLAKKQQVLKRAQKLSGRLKKGMGCGC